MRYICAIDTFVVLSVSDIGVVGGGRGNGGASRRASGSYRVEGVVTPRASSHWSGISMEAGIYPSRISRENASIFLSSGVAWAKEGAADCLPHSTQMWGVCLSTKMIIGGGSLIGKVSRCYRRACVGTT